MGVHSYRRAKDGATVYCAVFFGPDGRRKVRKVKTVKSDASEKTHERARVAAANSANVQRVAVENEEWRDPKKERPGRQAFGKLVKHFLKTYQTRSGSMSHYEIRAKAWLAFFGKDKPVRSITSGDVERFRNARSKKVSASTVRKDLVSLGTMFRWAKARGLVDDNPADRDLVKRPPEPRHERKYLTEDEEAKLLEHCPAWLRLVARWAILTGMDRGEILGLTWSVIDERAGVVYAPRSKTGAARNIPLNAKLREVLKEARKVRNVQGLVFLGSHGQPIHGEALKTALRRGYDRAGLTVPGPFKVFRHTFASRLAMLGHPPQAIARLMGHRTTTITDGYMHLSPEYLRDVMGSLDAQATYIEKCIENPGSP